MEHIKLNLILHILLFKFNLIYNSEFKIYSMKFNFQLKDIFDCKNYNHAIITFSKIIDVF